MSFDAVAKVYERLEQWVFGTALQEARCAHLERSPRGRIKRALLLGEGDGRFLEEFLRSHPDVWIDVLDASEAMVRLARRRVGDQSSVSFHGTRVEEFQPEPGYDLVVTHFFLDCFQGEELHAMVDRIGAWLRPGGDWWVADFQVPERSFGARMGARLLLTIMYRFFGMMARLKTQVLEDPDPVLLAHGMELKSRIELRRGLIRSDWWRKGSPGKAAEEDGAEN